MNTLRKRAIILIVAMTAITAASTRLHADTGYCGVLGGGPITLPFTDVPASNVFFCAIAEAYRSGLSNGTSATTFSPSEPVPREQMAALLTRTMDQSIKRGSRRAALGQFWKSTANNSRGITAVGANPIMVKSDGADLWVASPGSATVSRVRASDGALLGVWTGAINAIGILVAEGRVFVTGETNPGSLYEIDPTQPPGPVAVLTTNLGGAPNGIAFDGVDIWTANNAGSISSISLANSQPFTITAGFSHPVGIVFDGRYFWVTDAGDNTLKKLNRQGQIYQTIPVGNSPYFPVLDGENIWVPNFGSNSVTVVRTQGAFEGTIIATLTGLNAPAQAAFDGERILVTNYDGNSVSLFYASSLLPVDEATYGSFGSGTRPFGACSDGVDFWITLFGSNKLVRF